MIRQQVITPAAGYPVSRDYVKLSTKLGTGDVENDLLDVFIAAAAEYAENYTGFRFMKTELADYHEDWCTRFIFWTAGNVLSVDKVEYMPQDSTSYTELTAGTDYIADLHASPAAVKIIMDSLPDLNTDHPEAVKITYTAGYVDGTVEEQQDAVPKRAKQAIALIAAHWYLYRADYPKKNLTPASEVLLNQMRVAWL